MAGRIFAVVGPSGVGKDTLMAEAKRRDPNLHLVRRVITRPEAPESEPFESVSDAEFTRRKAAGGFVLDWEAHGLRYGIPVTVCDTVAEGRDVVFNSSRAVLRRAWQVFPNLTVIHVTASAATLATRLTARGRETQADIQERLAGAHDDIPEGPPVRTVTNDGALDEAVAQLRAILGSPGP